ncbi:MAG: hypothetical protein KKC01_00695 [Gammaproteobacteria bacterium]|nr:hypothetical protein [Gammaproteobacteria bacterium]
MTQTPQYSPVEFDACEYDGKPIGEVGQASSSDKLISKTYGLFAAAPASPPNANSGLLIRSAAVLLPGRAYNTI